MTAESDRYGVPQHAPGAKLDAGKNRLGLVLGSFANALWAVGEVGTYGANKYSDHGWRSVPNGMERYADAMLRHYFTHERGDVEDPETELDHLAHMAWNALAVLELSIANGKAKVDDIEDVKLGLDTDEEPDGIAFCNKIIHPLFADKSFTVLVIDPAEVVSNHNGPVLGAGHYYEVGHRDESRKWVFGDDGWRPTSDSGIINEGPVEAPSVPQDRPDVNHLGWGPSGVLRPCKAAWLERMRAARAALANMAMRPNPIMPGDYVKTKHDDTPRKVVGMTGDYKSVTLEVIHDGEPHYITHQTKEVERV